MTALSLTALTLSPPETLAGGFRLPDLSTAGMAMGNAMVANPDESGAIPYNPAAMVFQQRGYISAGSAILDHSTTVSRAGQSDATSNAKSPVAIPYIQISENLTEKLSVGLNINSPFGLETKWASNTFPGTDPTFTRVAMANFNPNVAYRVAEHTGISVGLAHYDVTTGTQNTTANTLTGRGRDTGYQLGFLHAEDNWSVGLAYRSAISVPLTGFLNGATPIKFDLSLPWLLQVGVRVKLNQRWSAEIDIERAGWSELIETRITTANGAPVSLNTNLWQDVNTYHLGVSYDYSDDTRLYGGYLYDNTPVPLDRFSARLPSSDFQAISFGIRHRIGDVHLQAGYQYFVFDTRNVDNNVPLGTYGNDGNGTDDYNGNYNTDVQQISISIGMDFN